MATPYALPQPPGAEEKSKPQAYPSSIPTTMQTSFSDTSRPRMLAGDISETYVGAPCIVRPTPAP